MFLIKPPKNIDEVYTVMASRYTKTTGKVLESLEKYDKNILDKIVSNNFTQADICEIVEKIIINEKEFNNESLEYSIKELQESKNAIKLCNFSKDKTQPDDGTVTDLAEW